MKKDSASVLGVLVVTVIGLCVIAGAFSLITWANDVYQDRKHVVIANSQTPVFRGRGQGCDANEPITLIQPGTVLPVRRIRYWKSCATVDVKLPDRRSGHLVLGVGDVSVRPPLN